MNLGIAILATIAGWGLAASIFGSIASSGVALAIARVFLTL